MANALYDLGRQAFLEGSIAWLADTIKVVLAKTSAGYTVNLATDQFLSVIAVGNQISKTAALASKSSTAGVANAASTVFTAPAAGSTGGALVIEKDTGTDATSPLIAYIDTATGLPVTTNGADINVTWNSGSNKIFKL